MDEEIKSGDVVKLKSEKSQKLFTVGRVDETTCTVYWYAASEEDIKKISVNKAILSKIE